MSSATVIQNSWPRTSAAWFPRGPYLSENAYWRRLRSALEAIGVAFNDPATEIFGARWLLRNRSKIQAVHLHFVQPFYHYEVIHARLRWVARFARNLLFARWLGYSSVFTLHNLVPDYPLQPAWVDFLGHWLATNLTDEVMVHSDRSKRLLAARYGRRDNVSVAQHPNYIDVYPNTMSQDEARSRLGLRAEHKVFAFIGGIRPSKGVQSLVEAFSRMVGSDLRLIVAGKPWPPTDHIDRLSQAASADSRIRLVAGYIPDQDIQIYANAADAIVLPFQWILTSGSTMLAMSFARPVVAPALGDLPEVVTADTGLLYDPRDRNALRRALERCLTLDLPAMGQCAFEQVRGYTWESLAAQTAAAYRKRDPCG